jgi:hypothetical protein
LSERRRLRALLEEVHPNAILTFVVLNVLFNTIAALLHDWIPKAVLLVAAVAVVCYLTFLVRRARAAATEPVYVQAKEIHVPRCRVVILFLSYRTGKTPVTAWLDNPRFRRGLLNPEVPKTMDRENWRMPVEGLAVHYPEVERVIVFTSSDYLKDPLTGAVDEGSYRQFADFKRLIDLLCERPGRKVEVTDLQAFFQDEKFKQGIDFENVRALVDTLVAVYRRLHALGYADWDIMVDVTGGPKITTVAGAAIVLGEDQVFQYISPRDHTPRAYDVTYIGES